MATCLTGLGSNLGDRQRTLNEAVLRLAGHPQIHHISQSVWLETTSVGGPQGQPAYLNGAAVLETSLEPAALLAVFQGIEAELGRRREERWGPHTIDLDLLLYDSLVLASPDLVLPHPRMAWRRFVLEPAAQVAPSMLHPTTGWTIRRLLAHLNSTPWYAAITGSIGAGKTEFAQKVAEKTGRAAVLADEPDFARLDRFYRDPSSHGRAMELEFLNTRARLLAAAEPRWSDSSRATISDFWFEQSAAFASVWLPPEEWDEYARRFGQAWPQVVRPRLVVLLDVPGDELLRRVRARGRACEQGLTAERLEQIGRAIRAWTSLPHQGPVLRFSNGQREEALVEVAAAVQAMR